MLLIFNADDAGYTPGVNRGIEQSFQEGVVRSTTLMANMEAFEDAVSMLKRNPGLSAGVHLNLTCGKPLSNQASLTNGNAMNHTSFAGALREAIRDELTLQIEKVKKTGIQITHIDSHHHVHSHPAVEPVALELARRNNLPLRRVDNSCFMSPDRLFTGFFGDFATVETIQKAVEQAKKDGVCSLEIMCHPGYCDDMLLRLSSYARQRERDLTVLCSPALKDALRGATLGSYQLLNKQGRKL
ncbi:MAG: carbohydrate deacetylase [Christensenellales bacterium]